MRPRRVVISGFGVSASCGVGKEAFWTAIQQGRSQVEPVSRFDTEGFRTRIAASIPPANQPRAPLKTSRHLFDLTSWISLQAAREATAESGLEGLPPSAGIIWGCASGGVISLDEQYDRAYRRGARSVMPYSIPRIMSSSPAALLAIELGAQGLNQTISSACASSSHALGTALRLIQQGDLEICLCGGAECPLAWGNFLAWDRLRVLSADNHQPAQACRPFSAGRNGMVLGEGGAAFVLEERARALDRGAPLLAEVVGYAANCDAQGMIRPSAVRQADCIRKAVEEAGWTRRPDYIAAHATGTIDGDLAEAQAIRSVFGHAADEIAVSSIKPVIGHTLGASGALSLASVLLAMSRGSIPPTLNLSQVDPQCNLDHVVAEPRQVQVERALIDSFAFGGSNAVLAVCGLKRGRTPFAQTTPSTR